MLEDRQSKRENGSIASIGVPGLVFNPSMQTLFLDFCSHDKLIAIIAGGKVLASAHLEDHTDETSVLPAIEAVVKKAGCTMETLGRIAATTGPGGFMSQRVGLSIANALSWSLKIPIAGIHLSDLYAARTDEAATWIHSTKKELLFVRDLSRTEEPKLMTLKELSKMEGMYVGEVLPDQAKALVMKPYEKMAETLDVLPSLLSTLSYGMESLTPWYGRGA